MPIWQFKSEICIITDIDWIIKIPRYEAVSQDRLRNSRWRWLCCLPTLNWIISDLNVSSSTRLSVSSFSNLLSRATSFSSVLLIPSYGKLNHVREEISPTFLRWDPFLQNGAFCLLSFFFNFRQYKISVGEAVSITCICAKSFVHSSFISPPAIFTSYLF